MSRPKAYLLAAVLIAGAITGGFVLGALIADRLEAYLP